MLKHTRTGYFNKYGITKLTDQIRGIYVIYNKYGPIYIDKSENCTKSVKELFNSNHLIWRYDPQRFEIEECSKNLDYRLSQLKKVIKLITEEDF